jgi:hypothetical protein
MELPHFGKRLESKAKGATQSKRGNTMYKKMLAITCIVLSCNVIFSWSSCFATPYFNLKFNIPTIDIPLLTTDGIITIGSLDNNGDVYTTNDINFINTPPDRSKPNTVLIGDLNSDLVDFIGIAEFCHDNGHCFIKSIDWTDLGKPNGIFDSFHCPSCTGGFMTFPIIPPTLSTTPIPNSFLLFIVGLTLLSITLFNRAKTRGPLRAPVPGTIGHV